MTFILKLFLTPILIISTTLAGRRWGPGVSGWLIGFPLTSGPVSLILALQHGPQFAAQLAVANLAGLASISLYCQVYSLAARRWAWYGSLAAGSTAFMLVTWVWNSFSLTLLPTLLLALAINTLVLWRFPARLAARPPSPSPAWDLPARVIVALVFVFGITTFAESLGPQLSGLLIPFPIFTSLLAAFSHHQEGAPAARHFLRGHLISLYGFAVFFTLIALCLPLVGLGAYVLALAANVGFNLVSLRLAR